MTRGGTFPLWRWHRIRVAWVGYATRPLQEWWALAGVPPVKIVDGPMRGATMVPMAQVYNVGIGWAAKYTNNSAQWLTSYFSRRCDAKRWCERMMATRPAENRREE